MKKLEQYIELERNNGYNIYLEYYEKEGPGGVDYERNCAIINNRFIWFQIKDFNEDCLTGVYSGVC